MRKHYRQGDLLLVHTDTVPKTAKKQDNLVLAEGEVTGHLHELTGGSVFDTGRRKYAVLPKETDLVHDEHDTVTLPADTYEVIQQRQYTPLRNERVVD